MNTTNSDETYIPSAGKKKNTSIFRRYSITELFANLR